MTRFALTIEFDGTNFCGLQRQENDPSIQQTIEEAAQKITGEDVRFFAAGRTDSGVHARAMVAHINVEKPFDAFRLSEALNAVLKPNPIAILSCEIVPDDWHARFSCIGRAYEYRIINRRAPLTLEKSKAWHISRPLDLEAMREGAQYLVGRHDFTTFRSAHCQADSPLKTLDRLDVRHEGDFVIIEAAARSFLHHQVRSMVGCLSLVGLGKWSPAQMGEALAAVDRTELGLNAPPDGLYFMKAVYPD